MLIKTLPVGQLETNCYIVANEDTLECVIIDPGDESNTILDYIEENKLKPVAVFITHGHFDHIGGVEGIRCEFDIPVYLNSRDDGVENARSYDEGDVLDYAGFRFAILATPGHTPGGVTIKVEDALFTGDTLFKGSCGRTDLPGGDMLQELASLKKICSVEGEFDVYPGHMDPTSLIREKTFNYYCRKAMQ